MRKHIARKPKTIAIKNMEKLTKREVLTVYEELGYQLSKLPAKKLRQYRQRCRIVVLTDIIGEETLARSFFGCLLCDYDGQADERTKCELVACARCPMKDHWGGSTDCDKPGAYLFRFNAAITAGKTTATRKIAEEFRTEVAKVLEAL